MITIIGLQSYYEKYHLTLLRYRLILNNHKTITVKTYILAIDFSENSIAALKYAHELSRKTNAELWAINIFNKPSFSSNIVDPYFFTTEESIVKINNQIKEICIKHIGSATNIEIEAIENSSVTNTIISKAVKLNASLIITGMKGKNPLNELLIGSTTLNLIHKSPIPLLTIPSNNSINKFENIIYATDFEKEDVFAISNLIEIVKPLNPTIKITHISTKKEYKGQDQMEWFKEILLQKVSYPNLEFYLFFSDNIYDTLQTFSEEVNADVIVMLERNKKDILRTLLHQDLVKRMKNSGTIPLLSFNEKYC
jgi:nucleotide-binding universal stress UspA family protein